MTARGAVLLIAPLGLIAAGAAAAPLYIAGFAVLGLAAAVVVVDGRLAPPATRVTARREHDEILSAGAANPVRVVVDVAGRRTRAWFRDEAPRGALVRQTRWRGVLPSAHTYTVTPAHRGELHFGRTVVRMEGPAGLGWRQCTVGSAETVRVDADLSAVRT